MSTPARAPPPTTTHLISIGACVCFFAGSLFLLLHWFPTHPPLFLSSSLSFFLSLSSNPSHALLWSLSLIAVTVVVIPVPYHLALRIGGVINLHRRLPIDCFEA
ncbi:hypothetical protein BC567DRAFT_232823 [Phyllosticta citribraziliensis]